MTSTQSQNAPRNEGTLEVVSQLLETSPALRPELAIALCGGDPVRFHRVMHLLDLEHAAKNFLERPLLDLSDGTTTPGQRIGRYILTRLIGAGGSAMVYEAIQDGTGQRAAVKTLRPNAMSPGAERRLEFEAEALGRLRHPGIAHVYEFGTYTNASGQQSPFLALEFVVGKDILGYTQRNTHSLPDKLRLLQRVCDAVEHAHQRGVIHRDLKPANILVDESGQPKVLDFGIARSVECDEFRTMATRAGDVLGTIQYMSPEQMFGHEAETTTRSDVYSLGVLAYRIVTGKFPYATKSSILAAAEMLRTHEPIPPRKQNSRISRDLDTILMKAIEKQAANRYASAEEFSADIERLLTRRPIAAKRTTPTGRVIKFGARNWRSILIALALASTFAFGCMGFIAGKRNAAHLEAQTVTLRTEAAKNKQIIDSAVLFTNLTTKYLRTSSGNPGTSWLHVTSFIESMMKQRFPIDPVEAHNLWEQRVKVAEDHVRVSDAAGTRSNLETLMIESSLCLWLLREGRALDALGHLDFVEPHWKKMLTANDAWLTHLRIFRLCANLMLVDKAAPNAQEERVRLFQMAQSESRSLKDPGTPISQLLEKVDPASAK